MAGETFALVVYGIVVGIAATATMDALASVSRRLGVTVGAKGTWVGRWYLGMARGEFVYSDITTAPERVGEKRAALIGHYVIGIVLAVLYVVGCRWLDIAPGWWLAAVGYGLATCVFPWFLLFPALGFGLFGLHGPAELKLLRTSVVNHLFYGVGLWWAANLFRHG